MRRIDKAQEPKALQTWRLGIPKTPTWDEVPSEVKDAIRTQTVRDQGALCCYCQARVHDASTSTKIEHFVARSTDPSRIVDWKNLHASCLGGEGSPPALQTCDTRKGARASSLDPLTIREEDFHYSASGEVEHPARSDVNDVLNLNMARLVRARQQAISGLVARLKRKRWTRTTLQAELDALEVEAVATLPPFAGLQAFWLRKRLHRHATR